MKLRVPKKPADSYQHGDLREALVTAGLKLLAEGGVERLSLRAAAQLAGVSHAAPYRHYRDKDALLAVIAERGFRLLTASMREELARSAPRSAGETLSALGLGYIAFAVAQPAYLQLIFGGVLNKKNPPAELQEAGAEAYLTLRNAVEAGIAAGELGGGSVDEVALACWSLVHGLSMLIINGAIPPPETPAAQRELGGRLLVLLRAGVDAKAG